MSTQVLSGKLALVTGGSRGIGAAISRQLAALGATVLVNYARGRDAAESVVKSIVAKGGKAEAIGGDVTDTAALKSIFAHIDSHHGGKLHILVNNAGVYEAAPMTEMSDAQYDKLFDVNVRSLFRVTREAVSRLVEGARVINIGSVVGEQVPAGMIGVYAASKHAVLGLTRGWARELAPRKITVNVVHPGPIDTDMNPSDATVNPAADYMRSMVPLGRYGTADEVAAAVVYLARPEAGYVNGAVLNVDGGMAV